MDQPTKLLPHLRTRDHDWWIRGAAVGGAVVLGVGVAGGTALAQLKNHTELWTVALVFVLVLSIVGGLAAVICGIGAFVTRPVPPDHATALRESAFDLVESIERGQLCNFGVGYRPDQAFCAHFKKLGKKLAAWDVAVTLPATVEQTLDRYLDASMTTHSVVTANADEEQIFNLLGIKGRARTVAQLGGERLADLEWIGFTTAGHPEIPGPPLGAWKIQGVEANWITATPFEGESEQDWLARTEPHKQQIEAVIRDARAYGPQHVQAAEDAQKRLEDFKRNELPTILDALRLAQVHEAPRIRHGCETC